MQKYNLGSYIRQSIYMPRVQKTQKRSLGKEETTQSFNKFQQNKSAAKHYNKKTQAP